jgi:hypothetical protein
MIPRSSAPGFIHSRRSWPDEAVTVPRAAIGISQYLGGYLHAVLRLSEFDVHSYKVDVARVVSEDTSDSAIT